MGNLTKDNFENGVILRLNGQFTGGIETDELDKQMADVAKSSNPYLIVDFSNVTFLGSIALGKIVKMHAEFSDISGQVVYCGFNSILQNVLKSTKVWNILNIAENLEKAKDMFD